MSGATKSGMLAVNANSYRPMIDSVKALAAKYEPVVNTFKGFMDKPGGTYWEGETASAGQANAKSGWTASARLTDIGEKLERDAGPIIDHTIVPNLTNGQHMIDNASKWEGVTVLENLKMTYTAPEGMSKEMADKNAKTVEDASNELQENGRKWYDGVQQVKALGEAAMREIRNEVNSAAGTFDVGKAVKDNAPRTTDPNATTVNYKEMYPKTPAAATDPAAIDPKVAALVPGLDPGATKAAGALAQGSLPELLDAASKAKPSIDPKAGSLTDNLLRIDPTMAARQSHVEKIPGQALDPNSPAGKATVDGLRGMYQSQGLPPAQIEAKVQEALKAGGQDQYTVKFADPNAPSATPSEHVSRDFGEQFNKFTNGISDAATRTIDGQIEQGKILTGQAGPGAPGVAEAWREVGINAAHQVHELTTDPLAAPKMGIEQAKDFINSPSEFIGKNIILGTEGLATGGIGGEAAAGARGLLGDLTGTEGRALTHGLDGAPGHTPIPHGTEPPPAVAHAPVEPPSGATHPNPVVDHPGGADHGIPANIEHAAGLPRSADDILNDARASHRAERDQLDWDRGEQNLHDIATHHGLPADQLPRTPQYDVDSPSYTDKHSSDHSAEIDRHTDLWEHGLNTQSVQQVLDNMEATRPPSTEIRNDLREGLYDYGVEDLIDAGYSAADAKLLARDYADAQFPTSPGLIPQPVIHNPDIKFGGYPEGLTYGDWQVNNALGNLTKQERDAFQAWLKTQDPNAIVNIRLGRE